MGAPSIPEKVDIHSVAKSVLMLTFECTSGKIIYDLYIIHLQLKKTTCHKSLFWIR